MLERIRASGGGCSLIGEVEGSFERKGSVFVSLGPACGLSISSLTLLGFGLCWVVSIVGGGAAGNLNSGIAFDGVLGVLRWLAEEGVVGVGGDALCILPNRSGGYDA